MVLFLKYFLINFYFSFLIYFLHAFILLFYVVSVKVYAGVYIPHSLLSTRALLLGLWGKLSNVVVSSFSC